MDVDLNNIKSNNFNNNVTIIGSKSESNRLLILKEFFFKLKTYPIQMILVF